MHAYFFKLNQSGMWSTVQWQFPSKEYVNVICKAFPISANCGEGTGRPWQKSRSVARPA